MVLAALSWAIYTVVLNRTRADLSPLATLMIVTVLALPPLGIVGGYELITQPVGPVTSVVVLGLIYVGVLASVAAFMAWSIGIEGIGAARGSIFLNLIPVFTAVIAVLTLGERIALVQLVGGLLVIGGVIWVVLSIPIQMFLGPMQTEWMNQWMAGNEDMPPEAREMFERMMAGGAFQIIGAIINIITAIVFGMLGGLLGVAIFKKNAPPPQPPTILPHDPGMAH